MTCLEGLTYSERRRLRYQADPTFRQARVNASRGAQGLPPQAVLRKQSWTVSEVSRVLFLPRSTLIKLEIAGVIPAPTYPSLKRMYWSYQVLLIAQLLTDLKARGWPRFTQGFKTDPYWTRRLTRVQRDWQREGYVHVQWTRRGSDMEEGTGHHE